MRTIDSLRDDILNNRYDNFKEKIIRINSNNKNIKIPVDQIDELAFNAQKMSYVTTLINYSINDKCISQKGFLKKLTNEINNTTKFNFSTLDTYKLMKEAIEQKKDQKILLKKNKDPNNIIVMKGGFLAGYFGWGEKTKTLTKVLDVASLVLDLAGVIPKIGIFIDALNIIIQLLRGEWVLAGLSLISIIPIIGTIGPLLKIGYQIIRDKNPENSDESLNNPNNKDKSPNKPNNEDESPNNPDDEDEYEDDEDEDEYEDDDEYEDEGNEEEGGEDEYDDNYEN